MSNKDEKIKELEKQIKKLEEDKESMQRTVRLHTDGLTNLLLSTIDELEALRKKTQ